MELLVLAVVCGGVVARTCRGTARHKGMFAPVAASLGATLVLWAQASALPPLATAVHVMLVSTGGGLMIVALMENRRLLSLMTKKRGVHGD